MLILAFVLEMFVISKSLYVDDKYIVYYKVFK